MSFELAEIVSDDEVGWGSSCVVAPGSYFFNHACFPCPINAANELSVPISRNVTFNQLFHKTFGNEFANLSRMN